MKNYSKQLGGKIIKCSVIYDADCPFCLRWVDRIRRLDKHSRFEMIPNQSPDLLDRFPQLKEININKAVLFIDEQGKVFTANDAAYQIAIRLDQTRRLAGLYRLPFARQLAAKLYDFFSGRRYKL